MSANLVKYKPYFYSYRLFTLLGILALFPFLIISFFNQPATDDYYFSYYTKLYSINESPFWMYNNVGGRYFANTILCFNPVYYECLFLFKIIPIVLLLLFCYSIYYFVKSCFPSLIFQKKIAIVGFLSTLFFIQIPDSCAAFYWLPGAISNQLPISLSLLFYAFLIKFYSSKKTKHFLLSVLFLIMALGCNEIIIVINLIVLFSSFAYLFIVLKKYDKHLLVIIAIAVGFSALEMLAPGNLVRANAILVEHDFLYSVVHSLSTSVDYFFKWLPILVLCCLFFIDNFYKKIGTLKNRSFLIHPIFVVGIVFSILIVSFFIGFWVNKNILPDRTINTIYFFYIITVLYFVICVLNYLNNKHNFIISITPSTKLILGILISLFFFANTPIYNAYRDIVSGKAYKYHQEIENRINIILSSKNNTVIVPSLKSQPQTIFKPIIMGLTTDIRDWKNEEISQYYNKNIVVQPTDSTFTE